MRRPLASIYWLCFEWSPGLAWATAHCPQPWRDQCSHGLALSTEIIQALMRKTVRHHSTTPLQWCMLYKSSTMCPLHLYNAYHLSHLLHSSTTHPNTIAFTWLGANHCIHLAWCKGICLVTPLQCVPSTTLLYNTSQLPNYHCIHLAWCKRIHLGETFHANSSM